MSSASDYDLQGCSTLCWHQRRKGNPSLPCAPTLERMLCNGHPKGPVSEIFRINAAGLEVVKEEKGRNFACCPSKANETQCPPSSASPFSLLPIHSPLTHSGLHPSGHTSIFIHSVSHWLTSFISPFHSIASLLILPSLPSVTPLTHLFFPSTLLPYPMTGIATFRYTQLSPFQSVVPCLAPS